MGFNTLIEWARHTFNGWWGCARVSPGCRFCYADANATRWGHSLLWRRHGDRRVLSDSNWAQPLKWNREAERDGEPARVFCGSMSDVFEDHPQLPPLRDRLFDLIDRTPWLTWMLLTKRIDLVHDMVPWGDDWPGNVWIGTSVENQRYATSRIPHLLRLPARVRFLSCEPLLGPVDLRNLPVSDVAWMDSLAPCPWGRVDWVIAGGESGPKARPPHPDWFRSLRDQAAEAGVPFFFKQWGQWAPVADAEDWRNRRDTDWLIRSNGYSYPLTEPHSAPGDPASEVVIRRVGKTAAGHVLDGCTWGEIPRVEVPA